MKPDLSTHLILKFSEANHNWEDITMQVRWYSVEPNCIKMTFMGSDKIYFISHNSLEIYSIEKLIDTQGRIFFLNGHRLGGIFKIVKYKYHYRIFYSDGTMDLCKVDELRFAGSEKQLADKWISRFNYYIELAEWLKRESDIGILADLYNQVNVSRWSILDKYLRGEKAESLMPVDGLCYPFGMNLSQKAAVETAFSHDISIIEGPPGTGKTQTILNIIVNAIMNHKAVALVSSNNSAIANVKEKLEKSGLGFLCALLGNADNKIEFFTQQYNHDKILAQLRTNDPISIAELRMQIGEYNRSLPVLYAIENRLAQAKVELISAKKEEEHFLNECYSAKSDELKSIFENVKTISGINAVKAFLGRRKCIGFLRRLFYKLKYHLNLPVIDIASITVMQTVLDRKIYEIKINEIDHDIRYLENSLKEKNFDDEQSEFRKASMTLLKKTLYAKYFKMQEADFTYDGYRRDFEHFIQVYPLILSTTFALLPSASTDFCFDYVIVDEASQTDLLSSVLAMSRCTNIVVVGDTKQLPQIEQSTLAKHNQALVRQYGIEPQYDYFGNNILTSFIKVFPEAPRTLLREHYRCNPRIINFCNQHFYENQLIIMTKDNDTEDPLAICKTVPGNHARRNPTGSGLYNIREIDEIERIISETKHTDVAVITPFRKQADEIQSRLSASGFSAEAETVHKFQGREREMVILSTVVNSLDEEEAGSERQTNFVCRKDLLNVAVSRAVSKLHLVVSDKVFSSSNNSIADLIGYIRYNVRQDNIQEGKITSVFDMLYAEYQEKLEKIRISSKAETFDSENIVYSLLVGILANYQSLHMIAHYPLRRLIIDTVGFSDEERRYLTHPFSHIDFLIYRALNKSPILAIEVDGIKYHEQDLRQSIRDDVKNRALKNNHIAYLRLRTNESKERERIITAIEGAIR